MNTVGDMKVWWIPQIPCKAFEIPVSGPEEAKKLLDVLARYDAFQFEQGVRDYYSNAGGLVVFDEDGDWVDWVDEETGHEIDDWLPK